MDNTIKEGDLGPVPEKAPTQDVPPPTQEQRPPTPEPPFAGFDADGYYVARIHSSAGYRAIRGHLQEAGDHLRDMTLAAQLKAEQEAAGDDGKIIRVPGGGRANRFK